MKCAICHRELIEGPSIDKHHLVPKTFGGKETILIHKICHRKIHSLFSDRELEKIYNTIEKINSHPDMINFIKWVQKKPNDFYDKNITSNRKKF